MAHPVVYSGADKSMASSLAPDAGTRPPACHPRGPDAERHGDAGRAIIKRHQCTDEDF